VSSRVSVVIATYNCGQFLAEAIESVLNQTLPPHEVIVVDDGSTDDTSAILNAFGERIRAVTQANAGVSTARNRGLELATGEYLAIMDADDICRPSRFAEQAAFLDRHPEVVAVGCQMERIDTSGQPLGKIVYATDDATIRFRMLRNSSLPHPGSMVRTADLVAIGGYDPAFPSCQDYDMWCRLSARGTFANLSTTLLDYRWHGKNITITAASKGSERAREISRRHLLRSGFAANPAEADAFSEAYIGDSASLTRTGTAALRAVWTRFLPTVDPAFRPWLRSVCLARAEECGPIRSAFLRWVSLARAVDPDQMRWDRVASRAVSSVRRKLLGTREGATP
jgi:GT2 family glycosyltransferase